MIDEKKWKLYESSFVKSMRRGLTDDALYWASSLYQIGKEANVWRRIFIHLSEDIGMANENLPSNIEALYQNYKRLEEKGETAFEGDDAKRLPLVHAIILLCESEKSRAVDNALVCYFKKPLEEKEVPDYAIDYHSPKGRRMGRDVKHFYECSGKIENETKEFEDQWKDRALKYLMEQENGT